MADIRIKDLTTTASSTASDDFIAVDGTTNGTRKLNAFSPTFGGNATVTGTLTVNGNSASVASANGTTDSLIRSTVSGTASTGKGIFSSYLTGLIEWQFGALSSDSSFRISSSGLGTSDRFSISSTGVVSVLSTTASTTTSTGALVVGGGVGVAGAINVAGNATVFGASGITINNVGGLGTDSVLTLSQSGVSNAFIKNTATTGDIAIGDGGGTYLRITKGVGVVSVLNSTASSTTSSGALVVSGGVGVAKEMYIGGGLLNVAKSGAGSTIEINADSGFASKLAMQRAATNRWTLEVDSSDVLTIKSLGTTAALTMTGTTSAEFVGSIKTAAPSGGTAANWKLGTVATVSPTSPNRTIEVDIGGTIYYLAAKTTNN